MIKPNYVQRAMLAHTLAMLKLMGREGRALIDLDSFGFKTLVTISITK